jgi:glutamate-1-semialdehyde 2,1-aminomutase
MTTTTAPATSVSPESARLHREACQYVPGGSSRVHYYFEPNPIYAVRGRGCRLTDADGIERLDFLNNMTALIHGHAHPAIVAAIVEQAERGTAFSEPAASEIELAKLMVERVKSVERIRFSNSGTEAVMLAVKLAREFTGRSKIAKFEGHYHGYYDYVQLSVRNTPAEWGPAEEPATVANSGGLAASVRTEVVTFPFNDLDLVERLLRKHGSSIAAFLVDPLAAQAGTPIPKPGFLASLTDLCRQYGIVLLYDEIVSFRVQHGGAQERYGGTPDLTTYGKIIGGGLPVGAVGGREDIMALLDPTRGTPRVLSGGTFSANPLTMVAGVAAMKLLTPSEFSRLNALGDRLRKESNRVFEGAGLRLRMGGDGSLFRINLVPDPVVDYRSAVTNAEPMSRVTALHRSLLDDGIIIAKAGLGCLSTAMGEPEVDRFVAALERAVGRLEL